jgi:hypothetical protein
MKYNPELLDIVFSLSAEVNVNLQIEGYFGSDAFSETLVTVEDSINKLSIFMGDEFCGANLLENAINNGKESYLSELKSLIAQILSAHVQPQKIATLFVAKTLGKKVFNLFTLDELTLALAFPDQEVEVGGVDVWDDCDGPMRLINGEQTDMVIRIQ